MNNRKKLYKLLGKDVEYTAIFTSHTGSRAVLTNLKHNGKLLCDHVCVSYHYALTRLEHGAEVIFNATATSYRDSRNERKYGINQCYKYRPVGCGYDVVKEDNAQKKKRAET